MATSKITSPVEGFNGKVVGVDFVDGSGRTDNENAINYFARHGYTVEAPKKPASKGSGDGKTDDKSDDSTGDGEQGGQA